MTIETMVEVKKNGSKERMSLYRMIVLGFIALCALCLVISYSLKSATPSKWKETEFRFEKQVLAMDREIPTRSANLNPEKIEWQKDWRSNELYNCKKESESSKFASKERLVHLDLKGAPPKISYYEKIFPLFKKMGATGLLIEYEDMFPYNGSIKELARSYAYNENEVKELLRLAKINGLNTIIPLVQTFGHMEFVLKHSKFADMRELPDKHNAISPSHPRAMSVIKEMIEQVSRLHPGVTYFHIGSDEVYGLGSGRSREFMTSKRFTSADLFLWHVKKVVHVVRALGHIPLMWDDMFRNMISLEQLKASGIGSLVELVVWKYSPIPQSELRTAWWEKYQQVFPTAWIASGFKGADSSTTYIVPIHGRVQNHINWIKLMAQYGRIGGGKMLMRGTILTGWQRFTHDLPLCELLPGGLPSLGLCLQVLYHGCFSAASHLNVSLQLLKCNKPLALDLKRELKEPSCCQFPGHEVYEDIQTVYCSKDYGGCNKRLVPALNRTTANTIRRHLSKIYYEETVTEWAKRHLS